MGFLSVFVEEFARAHTEAVRAALAWQRKQAGHACPKDDPGARSRAAPHRAEILDRLCDLCERRRWQA